MRRRIWTVVIGLVGAAALLAVPSALAAYTSTKLEIQQTGTKLTAKISANPDDDPTAAAQVYAPAGTQLTTNQAPGTALGTADVRARILALGGADVQLTGKIVVAAPGQVPPSQSAPCLRGATPLATWVMALQALGQTVNFPLYLVSTAGGPFAATSPAYVQVCLPAPDAPGVTDPTQTVKLYSATLTVTGVFSAVPVGAWISIWTPYTPKTGLPNPAGTVVAPAAVAPGAVSVAAKKKGLGAIVSGRVTQAGQARGGASVTIFGATRKTGLGRLGKVSVANGAYSFRARRGVYFKVTATAAPGSAAPLCAALAAQLPQGIPCVNPTVNGFVAQSRVVRKR